MVASGVPEKNNHHAAEVCKMALDLLAKVKVPIWAELVPFDVTGAPARHACAAPAVLARHVNKPENYARTHLSFFPTTNLKAYFLFY